MIWFLTDFARLLKERESIQSLRQEVNWLPSAEWTIDGGRLCLDADLEAHGHCYPVRMIYPGAYPASPPAVRPREPDQYWSMHQYGRGGELCLEWGPDNWHEQITGAQVLRSAHKLLETENPLGQKAHKLTVPSRHTLEIGQEVRGSVLRFVMEDDSLSCLRSSSCERAGTARFYVMFSRENITAFLHGLEPLSGPTWENTSFPDEMKKTTTQIEGCFYKTSLAPNDTKFSSAEALMNKLLEEGHQIPNVEESHRGLVLIMDGDEEPHLFWCLGDERPYPFAIIYSRRQGENDRLDRSLANLAARSVGIVGLGSAGSKIAVSLARSGVRSFLLVDHDVFMVENLCRHELDWEDIGQHKVDAIAHRIKLIATNVEVSCCRLMMSGQEATGRVDGVLSLLGGCDLLIDATADPATFNQLSHVAHQSSKPFVWLEVFAGGIGGLVGRFRPKRDPDPKTMRACLLQYLQDQPTACTAATANYAAMDGEQRTIIASDADVGVLSAHAARMAVDLLAEHEPSIFPHSLYLIGLSRGWIFEEPFHTIPIDCAISQTMPSLSGLSAEDQADAVSFIKVLIEKK